MFDIGWQELFIVAVLALIVVGPKDLPRVLKTVMALVRKGRAMAGEFQSGIDDMVREADLDDLKKKMENAADFDLEGDLKDKLDLDGDLKDKLDPTSDVSDALDMSAVEADLEKSAGEGTAAEPEATTVMNDPAPTPPHSINFEKGGGDAAPTDGGAEEETKE